VVPMCFGCFSHMVFDELCCFVWFYAAAMLLVLLCICHQTIPRFTFVGGCVLDIPDLQ
jgi:hypothetical protein